MTPIEEVFHDFVSLFERLDIPYAVMGGLAVRAHGLPRPTYDVDVTILLNRDSLPDLYEKVDEMGYDIPEPYRGGWVDRVAGMPLVKASTFREGRTIVVDIFIAECDFQKSLMDRRVRDRVNGFEAWLVTPEDLILLKLVASRKRDLADVQDVLTMNLNCDLTYLRKWADRLGIRDQLEDALVA